ncbi:MAG TPA: methyltransferase [Candidatus Dormibacteraeota bacterium]|nr:methyltransferase [Candidatus Dormibacteraeota bacterium]
MTRRRRGPVNVQALHRVLRGLAVLGVVDEDPDGRFRLGPLGRHLCSDDPDSARLTAIEFAEVYYPAWGAILHTIRTGEPAFPHVFEMDAWQFRAQRPELSEAFNRRMAQLTERSIEAILATYDFAPARTLVDVGGGNGTLLAALLRAHPDMRGVLLEAAHVVPAARDLLEAAGVAARCKVVTGDFFVRVPDGADAYVLKTIVHDWDDERAAAILGVCRRAMRPDSRMLLLERVLAERAVDDPEAVDTDLTMLLQLGGRERTGPEFDALLRAAGLRLSRIVSTGSPFSVIEAFPARAG